MMQVTPAQVMPIAVSAAGMFAVGLFLVNAVLTAYNITGTIEGPHDPKFKPLAHGQSLHPQLHQHSADL